MIIENITLADLKAFYPVTDSIGQARINELATYVKFNTFIQMFGLKNTTDIFAGTIADSANDSFLGFKKFVALCIVGQLVEDTFVHTNAGLKIVGQPNWTSPRVNEKNNTLVKINNTIENQFVEAKKVLMALGHIPENKYSGYSSFRIDKV